MPASGRHRAVIFGAEPNATHAIDANTGTLLGRVTTDNDGN